jgi:FlaA1/EpsC-like NDP-sugar epimerase
MSSIVSTKWPTTRFSSPTSPAGSAIGYCRTWLTTSTTTLPALLVLVVELTLAGVAFLANISFFARDLGTLWATSAAAIFFPLVLLLRGLALLAFGVFRRSRRHASAADVLAIAESAAASSCGWYLICRIWDFGVLMPSRVFVGDAVAAVLALTAFHFSERMYRSIQALFVGRALDAKRVIIVGAGDAGAMVLKDLLGDPRRDIHPVALIDDDPGKIGMRICGVPVAGSVPDLSSVMLRLDASEVLVCIPSASRAQTQHILAACRRCGVPVRALPALSDLVRQSVSSRDLRPILVEDLLPRKEVSVDWSVSQGLVHDKTVLVTGAGGSIGSELVRQIATAGPRSLILLDKSENNLFRSHMAVQQACPTVKVTPILADILDEHLINGLFAKEQPDLVFHAAAFKHVGMMERYPYQAIKNNVLGTAKLLAAATRSGVKIFVNISTDKAVNPSNYMGLSKRLAEQLVRDTAVRHQLRFMNVRFGNVAGSSGSVLQLFYEQIGKGGPLRITDPQASRYFMSISEAVYLVLCAASLGRGAETFILDMGKPINIYELARTVSLFSGLAPEEEMPIEFIGLRDGEKVHEELWEPWERPKSTQHPQILVLAGKAPRPLDIRGTVDKLTEFLELHDHEGLVTYLKELAPNMHKDSALLREEAVVVQEHHA